METKTAHPAVTERGPPIPVTRLANDAEALKGLWDLAVESDMWAREMHRRFAEVLTDCEGVELATAGELKAFKDLFDRIARRVAVTPIFADGSPGSLQVRTKQSQRAFTAIMTTTRYESTGYPPNTIPGISLGPLG